MIKTYTYDAAGNPLSDDTDAYIWNAAGRLAQVKRNNKTYQRQYNGLGERVNKGEMLNTNGRYFFTYDATGQLTGEYQENLATTQTGDWLLIQETIWFGDMPVAVIKQASPADPIQVYYIHTDHLNTPRVIVDATNTPLWKWANQNAFGDHLPDEGPDGNNQSFTYNLRFAGQYFDSETKLHYNYFRDYEPATGRYLSADPIGLAGGLNTYGYALQSPLSYVDPDGKQPICAIWPLGTLTCAIVTAGIVLQAKQCSDGVENLSEGFEAINNRNSKRLDLYNCYSDPLCNSVQEQALQDAINEADSKFRKNTVEAIKNLGASVPGTTMSGPIPTTIPDTAARAIVDITTSE